MQVLDLLNESKSFLYLSKIKEGVTAKVGDDFVRNFLSLFETKGHIQQRGSKMNPAYKLIGDYDTVSEDIKQTYQEEREKAPQEVQEYYERYGFDRLVSSVSKWISHEGIVEREYNIDRLWIGRYIDFLDKANEYHHWLKSDQAIARKKIADIRKHHKNKNSK